MNVNEALTAIMSLSYKPGWSFEASDHTNRFEDGIKITVHYPAFNSNRDRARKGYPERIETYATFALCVTELDTRQLYFTLIQKLMDIELHEAREFLRIPALDFEAPFHPHRFAGMMNWTNAQFEASRHSVGVASDLQFGVA